MLLDLPIPIENHGLLLPGLVYSGPLLVQLYSHLVCMEQLATHLYLLDKHNPLYVSQEQIRYSLLNQYQEAPNDTQVLSLIEQTKFESMRLNVWLNEQISGNILVMMISLLLGVSSLFMFINNVRNGVTLSTPDKLILVLCVINTPRGVQQCVSSVIIGLGIAFQVREWKLPNKVDVLLRLSGSILFLLTPTSIVGMGVGLYLITHSMWMFMVFLWGIWMTVDREHLLYIVTISLFALSYLSYIIMILNFMVSLLILRGVLYKQITYTNRLLLALVLNLNLLSIPFSLLCAITYIAHLRQRLLCEHPENNLFHNPTDLLLTLLVYQASLTQLPNSPAMLSSKAILIQVGCLLYFTLVCDFINGVHRAKRDSLAVRHSLTQWVGWVRETLQQDIGQEAYNSCDQVIGVGFMVLSSWLSISLNELFMWDTTPYNLGQEYLYLQDSVAYLCILVVICLNLWASNKQSLSSSSSSQKVFPSQIDDITDADIQL